MSEGYTRESLIEDYESELEHVLFMKKQGVIELDSRCWDFEKEEDDMTPKETISIDKVIATLSSRIERLKSEEDFDWDEYNY